LKISRPVKQKKRIFSFQDKELAAFFDEKNVLKKQWIA